MENEQKIYFRVVVLPVILALCFWKTLNLCIIKFSLMNFIYMYVYVYVYIIYTCICTCVCTYTHICIYKIKVIVYD